MSLFDFFKKKDKPRNNDDLFNVLDLGDSIATSSAGESYSQSNSNKDTDSSSSFYRTTEQNQPSSGFYSTHSDLMKEEPSQTQNAQVIKWLKYAVYSIEAILLALFLHYLLSYLKVY